jgi:hypothetical protein
MNEVNLVIRPYATEIRVGYVHKTVHCKLAHVPITSVEHYKT